MLPLLKLLSATKTAKGMRDGKEYQKAKTPMSKSNKVRILAIFPIIATGIALLLALLCVYAGHKPGYMEHYALFTLNVSRVGENVLQGLDDKISSVHFKRDANTTPTGLAVMPTITSAPASTFLTLQRKDVLSEISSLAAKASSDVSEATSAIASKVTSAESAVASKATSALGSIETDIIAAVNKAYHGAISELNLKDFYSIHISSSCSGTFVFRNGTNITVGDSGVPDLKDKIYQHVDSCSNHEAVDPIQLIRVLYWIAVFLIALPLAFGVFSFVKPTKKVAGLNVVATIPAFLVLGLVSSITNGVAVGAAKFINFIGKDVGIAGYTGSKFFQLTWAAVCLLIVNAAFWVLIFFVAGKEQLQAQIGGGRSWLGGRKRADRTSAIALGPISQTQPVYVDGRGHSMI